MSKPKDPEEITNDSSIYLKLLADMGKTCDEKEPHQNPQERLLPEELTPRPE